MRAPPTSRAMLSGQAPSRPSLALAGQWNLNPTTLGQSAGSKRAAEYALQQA
jgi:hypothetical protein